MFDTDCGISILQVCILFGGGTMQNFIFDSHAHYDDEAFEEDRHQVIQSLRQKGVCNVINVGANLERSKDSIALAAQYPFIYAAAGIHPGDVKDAPADYQEQLEQLIKQPKVLFGFIVFPY